MMIRTPTFWNRWLLIDIFSKKHELDKGSFRHILVITYVMGND